MVRVKISGHDTLSTALFSAVKTPGTASEGAFTILTVSLFQDQRSIHCWGYKEGVFIVSGYAIGLYPRMFVH